MEPNLGFFERHVNIKHWRFIVALSILVVVVYGWSLFEAINRNEAGRSAWYSSIMSCYILSLVFQLARHPNKNMFWFVVSAEGISKAVGPMSQSNGYAVFDSMAESIESECYDAVDIDIYLVQAKSKDVAIEEAQNMVKDNETKL